MSGWTPWRGLRDVYVPPPSLKPLAAPAGPVVDTAKLLAAAERECDERCAHAKAARELMHTLHAQEKVIADYQAREEARDRTPSRAAGAGWTPRQASGERA